MSADPMDILQNLNKVILELKNLGVTPTALLFSASDLDWIERSLPVPMPPDYFGVGSPYAGVPVERCMGVEPGNVIISHGSKPRKAAVVLNGLSTSFLSRVVSHNCC